MTMTRRKLVALTATTLVVLTASAWAGAAYTSGGTSAVRAGQGVGMYSDASTANQAATFTINRLMVSCGVAAEDIEGVGRFEMLMYSTKIKRYRVDSARKAITARGEMRSITRVAGVVVEDVRHHFIAHALDLDGDEGEPRQDRFEVHFRTPFWSPGQPMCTPSSRYPGLCRIGGQLIAGTVNVAEVRSDDDDDDD
jgi:hypothetical protein